MRKKINVDDLPEFDPAEHLKTDEDIALYLSVALEDDDSSELMHALGVVARARGMTEVARAAGLNGMAGHVRQDDVDIRRRQSVQLAQPGPQQHLTAFSQ